MRQQYLSIQDTHRSILANPRNPRLRDAIERRAVVWSWRRSFFLFIFFYKTKKNHRRILRLRYHREADQFRFASPAANGQLDALCYACISACVPRNYNSSRPNIILFPANPNTILQDRGSTNVDIRACTSHMSFQRLNRFQNSQIYIDDSLSMNTFNGAKSWNKIF